MTYLICNSLKKFELILLLTFGIIFSSFAETCIGKCTEGYTFYYGYCLRTRYTLPEADEATSDDNENSIEWIFE